MTSVVPYFFDPTQNISCDIFVNGLCVLSVKLQ